MRRVLIALALPACAADKGADTSLRPSAADFRSPGPNPVTVHAIPGTSDHPPVLFWAPTAEGTGAATLAELEADPDRAATMAGWVDAAPAGCPTPSLSVQLGAPVVDQPLPLVWMSHCHECTASSLATVAVRLASWGLAVAAISHEGNTLYDVGTDAQLGLDTETLALRVGQVDAVWARADTVLPATLDLDRVAMVGHSFGAVTTGMVAQRDGTLAAAVFLGAPADNPLLPGVDAGALDLPTTWLLLEEDNSIGAPGNALIESNAAEAPGETRLVRMPDAGHWSVSDIVGVAPSVMPGCGEDTRQDGSGELFSYPEPSTARETTAALVAAALVPVVKDGAAPGAAVDELAGWQGLVVGE